MRQFIVVMLACAVVVGCKPQASNESNASKPVSAVSPAQSQTSPDMPTQSQSALPTKSDGQKPMDLNALVPSGYKVVATGKGDLNGDGLPDAIVVADEIGEANAFTELRRVVLVAVQRDGEYTLAAKSDKAARCATCGGVSGGDPLHALKVLPGNAFSIQLAGGSREKWLDRYVFKYDPAHKSWMLDFVESSAADPDSGKDSNIKLGPDKFGVIPFDKFDPDAIPRAEVE